jgi:hypothetical protein
MSYSRLFKLGSTTMPLGTSVSVIDTSRTIGSQKLARAHGNRQTIGYRNGSRAEVEVPICKGPLDLSAVRPRIDAVRAIFDQGPANLYFHDDRYLRCVECESEPNLIEHKTGFDRIHAIRAVLIGPDDVYFGTASNTEAWTPSSGTEHSFTVGGDWLTYPTISLTVGGSGLETIAFEVSNTYTWRGTEYTETFTLAGDVTAGDVIVVKCLSHPTVKIAGVDRMDLFDQLFLKMSPGTNGMTISWTASSVTGVSVVWPERYR